jgi:hypothetical protein
MGQMPLPKTLYDPLLLFCFGELNLALLQPCGSSADSTCISRSPRYSSTMRRLVLTVSLIAATAAIAADWVLVDEDTEGTLYIDRDSVRTTNNGYKRAWDRYDFREPDTDGDTGRKALNEYDCREGRFRTLQFSWLSGEEVTSTNNYPDEWSDVEPGTFGETMLNYVCFGKLRG